MEDVHIAFGMMGDRSWVFGLHYLRTFLRAIRQTYGDEVKLSVFTSPGQFSARELTESIAVDQIIEHRPPRRWSPRWAGGVAAHRLSDRDPPTERDLRQNGVTVLFGRELRYRYPNMASISWLPDFQHKHLPQMFDAATIAKRNHVFLQSARVSTRLLLMSETVRQDFEALAPEYAHKARVLRPISHIPAALYDEDPATVRKQYHLPEKFVCLPNQFWKHKNHAVVFEALRLLREQGSEVTVVCVGYPSDHRHAGYFADLWQELSLKGVRDQVLYLGLVPHEDVLRLMRQSVGVINPSFYEGWGAAADEARWLGKDVILSDIAAHREHGIAEAIYFDAQDADDLAAKLGDLWENATSGPNAEREAEARARLDARVKAYAEDFVSISREALEEVR